MPTLLALSAVAVLTAQTKHKENADLANLPDVIWRDPGDVTSLKLLYGAGGEAHAPDPSGTFTFEKEDLEGASPKLDIEDNRGVRWRVKLGPESQSETAATRLLWAVGYFVDEDYYLAELKVTGVPTLRRGESFISADGTVRKARLERKPKEVKKLGTWDWFDNPFLDTRELNGLRVMMSLLNNWDLKESNNSIEDTGRECRYVVSDVGATFGRTGNSIVHSKSVALDYASSPFIDNATPDFIDFVLRRRPFFLSALNVPNYRALTRMEQIAKHIPRADAKWLGKNLARLSEGQVRDAFRAGGYTPDEIELYTQTVRMRIAELNAL